MDQPDILEALTEIADAKPGDPMPSCMAMHTKFVRTGEWLTNPESGVSVGLATNEWGVGLSEIARRAKEEIVRNRAVLARCMGGPHVIVDIGNGEMRALYQEPEPKP